jgi:hypothetical protein
MEASMTDAAVGGEVLAAARAAGARLDAAERDLEREGRRRPASRTSFAFVAGAPRARCSFCGKTARTEARIVAHGARRVCGACLHACRDIIDLA